MGERMKKLRMLFLLSALVLCLGVILTGCFNRGGEEGEIQVPTAPTNVTVTPGDEQMTLSWSAPTSNGGSAITRYEVQRTGAGGGIWSSVALATTHTFEELTNGTEYIFMVRAVNVAGEGAFVQRTAKPSADAVVITPATEFSSGEGTEHDPFIITNASELYFFAERVNEGDTDYNEGFYEMANDIYLNDTIDWQNWGPQVAEVDEITLPYLIAPVNEWVPIGININRGFMGTFDGKGFAVFGVYICAPTMDNQGLFGRVSGGIIKNLGVEESYIWGKDHVGGVAASVFDNGGVWHSYNKGIVRGNGHSVGGVVGRAAQAVISGCDNTGSVVGNRQVGGILGTGVSDILIATSNNAGRIFGDPFGSVSTGFNIGGIAGVIQTRSTISDSENEGTVQGVAQVGGIIGSMLANSAGDYVNILRCNNIGDVAAIAQRAGGIAGWVEYGVVQGSRNSGKVSGTERVGGIVGYMRDAGYASDCSNDGNITGILQVGGIVGYAFHIRVFDCANRGLVRGRDEVGGITGDSYFGSVSNSYNTALVTGTGECIGGITGFSNGSNILNNFNTGTVTGAIKVGGITGYANAGSYANSFNTGQVAGGSQVGGLIGFVIGNQNTVRNCYMIGTVSAPFFGDTASVDGGVSTDIARFNSSGTLDTEITFEALSTDVLHEILNVWVSFPTIEAPQSVVYKPWTLASIPTFV